MSRILRKFKSITLFLASSFFFFKTKELYDHIRENFKNQ